eukprot:CFRG3421T1
MQGATSQQMALYTGHDLPYYTIASRTSTVSPTLGNDSLNICSQHCAIDKKHKRKPTHQYDDKNDGHSADKALLGAPCIKEFNSSLQPYDRYSLEMRDTG